jgi:oxygen-independent coproporphyrinogen-3 oxidase
MDFVKAVECLQAVGFKNINVDMMIGIPKQKLSDVRQTIYAIEKLGITHISCYSLILENNTPMHTMVQSGDLREPNEDKTINMYSYVHKYLDRIGYKRYEVSNFAIPGYECKHNMNTWHLHEYMGIGVSAHGYLNGYRYANTTSLDKYIKDVSNIGTSIEYSEEETNYDIIEEYIMLGLRLNEGIDLKYLKDTYSYDLLEYKKNEIKKLKDLGLIDILDNRLFATNNGFYVLNAIIIELV